MALRKLVFLSDIHIGTNQPVNWYQKEVHEPYLRAVFNYIIDNAADIEELIVLGDMFDFWTYLPGDTPPEFQSILKANGTLFVNERYGQYGLFEEVLSALKGQVSFLHGNHDMTVKQTDLDLMKSDRGMVMGLIDAPTYKPKAGLGQVVCTHGHLFSVFCAPDPATRYAPLPIGHFVTRLAALWDHNQLQDRSKYPAGSTVADMPNTGTPVGWGFTDADVVRFLDWLATPKGTFAELVFDIIIGDNIAKQKAMQFRMPDGTTPNAYDLGHTTYKSTYDEWVKRADSDSDFYGPVKPGYYALKDVDLDDSLVHFADGLGQSSKVVVMGHTHVPEDESEESGWIWDRGKYLYVNCGFNCPSIPDMFPKDKGKKPKHPTFIELEIDDATKVCTALVRYVEKAGDSYRVAGKPLEQKQIKL
jgi:UDP-2,3-diacylglucosamine pyrophosphatase LpxH